MCDQGLAHSIFACVPLKCGDVCFECSHVAMWCAIIDQEWLACAHATHLQTIDGVTVSVPLPIITNDGGSMGSLPNSTMMVSLAEIEITTQRAWRSIFKRRLRCMAMRAPHMRF
jgi:hypothetical protein